MNWRNPVCRQLRPVEHETHIDRRNEYNWSQSLVLCGTSLYSLWLQGGAALTSSREREGRWGNASKPGHHHRRRSASQRHRCFAPSTRPSMTNNSCSQVPLCPLLSDADSLRVFAGSGGGVGGNSGWGVHHGQYGDRAMRSGVGVQGTGLYRSCAIYFVSSMYGRLVRFGCQRTGGSVEARSIAKCLLRFQVRVP